MNVLQRILEQKRSEVQRQKRRLPPETLASLLTVTAAEPTRGFAKAVESAARPRVIAEVKRASPSKGIVRPQAPIYTWQPELLARTYEAGGACALSVLTDVHFFWGHPDALGACRAATRLPVLRKDFIIDPYQVDESRWLGADAILLIVAALDPPTLKACARRALELGMDVLVEVHEASEIDAALGVDDGANGSSSRVLIGINNRNLSTLAVDVDHASRLRERIPAARFVVAESGLGDPAQLLRLSEQGFDAFLVGEHLARQDDPAQELARLRGGHRHA